MRRSLLSLATSTAALAAALAVAAPAGAGTYDHDDATGDTWRFTAADGSETWTPAPEATEVDLTSVTIRHGRRIKVTVTGADFTRESGAMLYTLRAGRRETSVFQRIGSSRDYPRLDAFNSSGRDCAGANGEVDRATDTAWVSIPRGCLGRSDWVRAGTGHVVFEESRRRIEGLIDDALTDGQPGDELAMSPRVYHRDKGPVPE